MSKPDYDKKSNPIDNKALNNSPVDNDNGLNTAQASTPPYVTPTHGGVDVLQLLNELEELGGNARKIFGSVYYGFDEEKHRDTLMKIRANLPVQIKQASKTLQESKLKAEETKKLATTDLESARSEASRLKQDADKRAETALRRAEEDAESILASARERAALMVSDTEIIQRAQIEAQEILQRAHAEAQSVQQGASDYAYEVLSNLEGALGKAMTVVGNGRAALEQPASRR